MSPEIFWSMAFGLLGGLGVFLLGMKNMSEGTQALASNTLRRMISVVTNNPLSAIGVGTIVTMMIQSSSITTVMVVGFVNGGLMTLYQAVGVVMGANIGTTITGWILTLKIGDYGLPILGVSAFVYLFSRGERLRYMATLVMGVGMIFFGLELMKDACAQIKEMPAFEEWLHHFEATDYIGVLQCMLTGCVLTLLVQSSSATLGITIALALTGTIQFETAAALVLGENVGTTITAFLASIGATTAARRAAYYHIIFNVLGAIWISTIFFYYKDFVLWLLQTDVTHAVQENGQTIYPNTTAAIATTHTLFNVANTLIFLPFAYPIARLLERYVPDRRKEKHHLATLDIRLLETPVIAIEQSRIEVLRMADGCTKMLDWLRELLTQDVPDQRLVRKLFHREEVLDTIQDEVTAFVSHLLASHLPEGVIDEARRQLRMADEYESVSDYISSIAKFYMKLLNQGHRFEDSQLTELLLLHDLVTEHLQIVSQGYVDRQPDVITRAHSSGNEIKHRVKKLRDDHLASLSEKSIPPHVNVAFTSALNSYRRVRDHTVNIAETVAGEK